MDKLFSTFLLSEQEVLARLMAESKLQALDEALAAMASCSHGALRSWTEEEKEYHALTGQCFACDAFVPFPVEQAPLA